MHIWNQPWPFIYEHHNRVPMLQSVTFDKIATLVWNFYWAHKFVARWIRYSCVYFYFWPFRFVAISVWGRSGLWPFRFVAVPVCGLSGLCPFRFVAVSVCGRSGLWPFRSVVVSVCGRFGLWPLRFRFVVVMTRIRYGYGWVIMPLVLRGCDYIFKCWLSYYDVILRTMCFHVIIMETCVTK